MPTATSTSSQRTPSDDAPRAAAPRDEATLPKPPIRAPEIVDADEDPYDNVACTD